MHVVFVVWVKYVVGVILRVGFLVNASDSLSIIRFLIGSVSNKLFSCTFYQFTQDGFVFV